MTKTMLVLVCCFVLPRTATGDMWLMDGEVHDIDSVLPFGTLIVWDGPGDVPTTLNLLQDGYIDGNLLVDTHSIANIFGGTVSRSLLGGRRGSINMVAGLIREDIDIRPGAVRFTMSGGTVEGLVRLREFATATIIGRGFLLDGQPVSDVFINEFSYIGGGRLTGVYFDGSPIDLTLWMEQWSRVVLIPEPATILLLGIGMLFARQKKRRMTTTPALPPKT